MYQSRISNRYLGESKLITAKTQLDFDQKVRKQKEAWKKKEIIEKAKIKAIEDTDKALDLIYQYQSLLLSSTLKQHKFNWDELYRNESFNGVEPNLEEFIQHVGVPKENKFIEFFLESERTKRLEKEKEAQALYLNAKSEYEHTRNEFYNEQKHHNQSIDNFKKAYEEFVTPFVERYFTAVLNSSIYPKGLKKNFDVQYLNETKTLIIDFDLPHHDDLPQITEHRFVQARQVVSVKTMKKKDFDPYYDDVLYQITLRTIHECLDSDYADSVELIVFNGWSRGVDTSNGQDFHSCILSLQTSKSEFQNLNLTKVVPKDCFRSLKGINAGALHQLAPIRPIMHLDKDDKRFIESKEILAEVNSIPNLAEMPWDDFEHLVTELFSLYFSKDGIEVKVTRSSRDGGVDAVAIDPDPIRGGKFIIQAKRYNNVVPITAVRELNGIMSDEVASKGILVTTSYFGNDTREFVKDKPITLIDGPNLMSLFQDFGYKVRIDLVKKEKAN
ncbi:restriction endonuclease [Metabacillus schmidteae]|uniref:restriction endonuclease n=1 Tax=Metabacillus schmidteae TaxID=2730405 RepID=UPI00158A90A8|nr:restriction endonuclease [Metabacillus schmidteae]